MRLSQRWTNHLAGLPETGMGYQIIDVHLQNGGVVKNLMVMNCQDITGQTVIEHGQLKQKPASLNFSENDITDITMGDLHS